MRAALAIALALLAACRTTSQSSSVGVDAVVAHGLPAGTWQVLDGERVVGYVVRFVEEAAPERDFFSVRNARHQELGLIDRMGRAFRYRPHAREPDWLGSGTVLDGARRILGAGTALEPLDGDGASDAPLGAIEPGR